MRCPRPLDPRYQCSINLMHAIPPEQLRKRMTALVEHHFRALVEEMERDRRKVMGFNEALLQEWTEMLQRIVYLKEGRPLQVKPTNTEKEIELPLLRNFPPPIAVSQNFKQNCLLAIDANSCELFKMQENNSKIAITPSKLSFPKGYLRKYCSYNFIDREIAVLIGGSRQSNPNLKSRDVFTLNIENGHMAKLAELPYGISSHAAVRVKEVIYVIGGNKDMNIVTKSCLAFNYISKEMRRISDLNYSSASHSAISWKDKYIYKFGGVGSSFEQWGLSPYVQRYNLAEDLWELINPQLKINQKLFDQYSLLANSLAVASQDHIIIFGGFDLKFSGSNKLMQMSIKDDHHQITSIGTVQGMEAGGFFQQEPIHLGHSLFAVQSIPNQGAHLKIVSVSSQLRYY